MLTLRHLGIILAAAFIISMHSFAAQEQTSDIIVIAEGSAVCKSDSDATCRQAALAAALRTAVEKAVGVLVEARTQTKNHLLVQDTIRTTSDGFVRDYRILDEQRENGIYRLKIEAKVAPGSPEIPLSHICRRLREEKNPEFRVLVADQTSAKILENMISTLGLRVSTGSSGSITIRGHVELDALGEAVEGTKIFSASASTSFSVIDTASGILLPSMNVSLAKPAVAISQAQANRQAIMDTCTLWIQRNIPLIAAVLLEPGETVAAAPTEVNVPPTPVIPVVTLSQNTPMTDKPAEERRLSISPNTLDRLAQKLKSAVVEKSEFDLFPVNITVAQFKVIGINDPGVADDVLEDLSTALVKTGTFEVVERNQLDKVLQELRIQNSGLIDSMTAMKLGKLVGARAVLIGSISDRKDCIVINARLINTETGRIRVAESITEDKELEPFVLQAGPRSKP